jgi:hypothetical protein
MMRDASAQTDIDGVARISGADDDMHAEAIALGDAVRTGDPTQEGHQLSPRDVKCTLTIPHGMAVTIQSSMAPGHPPARIAVHAPTSDNCGEACLGLVTGIAALDADKSIGHNDGDAIQQGCRHCGSALQLQSTTNLSLEQAVTGRLVRTCGPNKRVVRLQHTHSRLQLHNALVVD